MEFEVNNVSTTYRARLGRIVRAVDSKRRIVLPIAGIMLAASLTVKFTWGVGNVPKYDGKTVRDWLTLLDSGAKQTPDHDRAADAMVRIGAPAIPELERILRRKPKSFQEQFRRLAARLHLRKPDRIPLEEEQRRAARAAWVLADRAGADIGVLITSLQYHLTNSNYADPENGRALANAGSGGIAVLTNLLVNGELHARGQSAWALHLARTKPGVVDALLQAVNDPDRSIRVRVLLSLRDCDRKVSERIIPVGLDYLGSLDPVERWAGAKLLQEHITADRVSNALREAAGDLDERVRSAAIEAFRGTLEHRTRAGDQERD